MPPHGKPPVNESQPVAPSEATNDEGLPAADADSPLTRMAPVESESSAAPSLAGLPPTGLEKETARASGPQSTAILWLRRGDLVIVWLLVVALLGLLGIHWLRLSRWARAPVELSSQQPREYYYSLDINTASWVEWAQLDGIGEKLARRIIADRDEKGPFRHPDDVSRVRGIGPKLLEQIRPFLKGGTASEGASPKTD